MNTYERLRHFLKLNGITLQNFEKIVGLSNGYAASVKNPSSEVLEKISLAYPDLNFDWLISGSRVRAPSRTQNY